MAGVADTIKDGTLPGLLDAVTAKAKNPEVMRLAFMLSYYAGLRVQEIAGLEWDKHIVSPDGSLRADNFPVYDANGSAVKDADGELIMRPVPVIVISDKIGKLGVRRVVPIHPQLAKALAGSFIERPVLCPFVIPSGATKASQALKLRAHALKMRIRRVYVALNMPTFSSHSGRRTFITTSARKANAFGNSLKDVQQMVGHRNLVTTEGYIETSPRWADLVENMYGG
jgi:integrase/recombinase XerD